MQVINEKNKYFISIAVFAMAIFSFIQKDYYSVAALAFLLLSVLTTFNKENEAVKNTKLMQNLNLIGYVMAAVIWIFDIYINK